MLTDAAMDQWDLNLAPDGTPIEAGIFAEMHAALGDAFTQADAARAFGNLVASEPRIHAIVGAQVTDAHVTSSAAGSHVDGVTFAGSGKRDFSLAAPIVIDATDDADVAAAASARYDVGRQDTGIDEGMQAVTLMFTIDDIDWPALAAAYDVRVDGPGGVIGRRAWGYAKLMDGYRPLSSDVLVRDLNLGHEDDGSVSVQRRRRVGDRRAFRKRPRAREEAHSSGGAALAGIPAAAPRRVCRRTHRTFC